jgi:integrase
MIDLQLLTGMRPGEVVLMRGGDLDMTGEVWTYAPEFHKTEHHGRDRHIAIGPRAQVILKEWLRPDPAAYLFSPREAMAERWAERRRNRMTPLSPSQRARRAAAEPGRRFGDRYSVRSYCHAIGYGCRQAGIAGWHPNRLRHSTATALRRRYGLEASQVVLGHAQLCTTEIYAQADLKRARQIMSEVG